MTKIQSIIGKVSLREVNGAQRILIEMKSNHQLWVAPSYVDKLLASQFMAGARPTALIGSSVSYDKVDHKKGDAVMNKGVAVTPAKTYEKDGYSIENFQVEELGDKAEKFGDMVDKATIKAKLSGASKYFTPKAVVVTPEGEIAQAETTQVDANEPVLADNSETAL